MSKVGAIEYGNNKTAYIDIEYQGSTIRSKENSDYGVRKFVEAICGTDQFRLTKVGSSVAKIVNIVASFFENVGSLPWADRLSQLCGAALGWLTVTGTVFSILSADDKCHEAAERIAKASAFVTLQGISDASDKDTFIQQLKTEKEKQICGQFVALDEAGQKVACAAAAREVSAAIETAAQKTSDATAMTGFSLITIAGVVGTEAGFIGELLGRIGSCAGAIFDTLYKVLSWRLAVQNLNAAYELETSGVVDTWSDEAKQLFYDTKMKDWLTVIGSSLGLAAMAAAFVFTPAVAIVLGLAATIVVITRIFHECQMQQKPLDYKNFAYFPGLVALQNTFRCGASFPDPNLV